MSDSSMTRSVGITGALIGGTFGAAGWIMGAAMELLSAGYGFEAALVFLCAAGVLLTGGAVWCLWLIGRRFSLFLVVESLLGASLSFGLLALVIMRARGVVAFAVDSSGEYSEGFAYAAPVAILVIMGVSWWTPIRKRLRQTLP